VDPTLRRASDPTDRERGGHVRKKLIIATTAGVLSLTGLAVAVPALAAPAGDAGSSAVERITEALSGLVSDGSLTQDQAEEVATTLGAAGIGGHGGRHGGGFDLEAAATALGLTEDELRTALATDGTTLAQVAEDEGVAVDTLIDALVRAQQERIAQAVEDGRLTQDEADERLADLAARTSERVHSADPGRGRGHGPGGGHGRDGDERDASTED
jgi:polyhydroxyalkanoate synthesis regulator phasin